jgi:hypothetical protein
MSGTRGTRLDDKPDNVKWVADMPGWGWSCPIAGGDHAFLTAVVSDEKNLTPSKGLDTIRSTPEHPPSGSVLSRNGYGK